MARQTLKVTVKKVDGRDVSQHVRLILIDHVACITPVTGDANDSEVFVYTQGIALVKLTVDETVATLSGQIPAGWELRFNAVARGVDVFSPALDVLVFSHRLIDCRAASGSGATFTVTRTTNTVTAIAVATPGRGYTRGATITITGGGGSNAAAVVTGIDANGGITAVSVTAVGSGYTGDPTIGIDPGSVVRVNQEGVHYTEYLTTNTMANLETQLVP